MKFKVKPLVSIVIPCYNVDKYISVCLNSVVNQTLKNIEIICINDGSTDNTLKIINEFKSIDSRILIINKKNTGYGDSMNIGIEYAKSDFVGIVEPDDYIELDMFEILYNTIANSECDFVKSDYFRFKTKRKIINCRCRLFKKKKSYYKVYFPKKDKFVFNVALMNWTGIFRKSFLNINNIRHNTTSGASFQDTGFWFMTFACANKIEFIPYAFYHYRQDNPNSSMNNHSKIFAICNEFAYIQSQLKTKNIYIDYIDQFSYHKYLNYKSNFRRINNQYKSEFMIRFRKEFLEMIYNNEFSYNMFNTIDKYILKKILYKGLNNFKFKLIDSVLHPIIFIKGVLWYLKNKGIASLLYVLVINIAKIFRNN